MIEIILGAEPKFDNPASPVYGIIIFFSAIWIVGLIVLIPIQVLYFERKTRKNKAPEKMTAGDVVGLPLGAFNPNAELPKWIAIPVKIFFWGLVGFFVLFTSIVLIGIMVSHFFAEST